MSLPSLSNLFLAPPKRRHPAFVLWTYKGWPSPTKFARTRTSITFPILSQVYFSNNCFVLFWERRVGVIPLLKGKCAQLINQSFKGLIPQVKVAPVLLCVDSPANMTKATLPPNSGSYWSIQARSGGEIAASWKVPYIPSACFWN